MLSKPDDVYDRDSEWEDMADFAGSSLPGLRIAVVYGRRRQGKSYLLRRLAEGTRGLYFLATEQTEPVSLSRFAGSLATWLGAPGSGLMFDGWESALSTTAGLMLQRVASTGQGQAPVLILDEFSYLVHATPGLPSIVQGIYEQLGPGSMSSHAPLRLVLCGSAISIMSQLLSGTKALRGRGALDLKIKPFGFRETRQYWGIENVQAAFVHHALLGGTPGYRDLVLRPEWPEDPAEIGQWMARNVLRPAMPLFDEANRVIHEDPRLRDTALYGSLMAAIAAGESSPTKIGGLLGRPASALSYQLRTLESAGFVDRRQDLLMERHPVITVADPVVRLHHLVIEPQQADLEAGRALQVWQEAEHTIDSKILGPHFEALATEWVTRYARDEADLQTGVTGHATVACREHKTSHEIDILALEPGARRRTSGSAVAFVGEAKSGDHMPGIADLERLEHIRALLTTSGHDATKAVLGLFSANGFSRQLATEAARRSDRVLLTGLDQLYGTGR